MHSKIIEREKIILSPIQQKMIKSGWGDNTIDNTTVEKITYLSDGLKVKGYIAYPNDVTQKYPCVIWCRGGIGNAGSIDEFNASGIFGQIASWGYVVFASQYRGNAGGEGKDEFGGDDVNDVINLIPLAEEFEFADITKWGIEGWSRGGMMTYLTLTKTNLFKAAIVIGGIANLRCNSEESKFMRRLYEVTMGKAYTDNFKVTCESRSIINFPEKLAKNTPLLLLHGTADDRVLVHDSIDLAAKLKELNHPHELVLYENGDHFLKSHRKEVNEKRKEWFKKHLSN
ncbi:MAG: S9 family peptidase [Ignavibacteria bacterium]|nr:S9 family peptidase [Ignavibacteria bacterium]